MNDFLRPCNCVHPADEDCEKCVAESDKENKPEAGCGKDAEKCAPSVRKSTRAKDSVKP